jgi:hypothetical protein
MPSRQIRTGVPFLQRVNSDTNNIPNGNNIVLGRNNNVNNTNNLIVGDGNSSAGNVQVFGNRNILNQSSNSMVVGNDNFVFSNSSFVLGNSNNISNFNSNIFLMGVSNFNLTQSISNVYMIGDGPTPTQSGIYLNENVYLGPSFSFIGAGSGLTGSGSNTRVVFWNGTQSLSSTTRFTFVDATSGTTGAQLTIGAANNTNTGGQLYLAQSDSYTNAGSIIRFGTTAGNTNQWTILAFGLTYSNTNDGSGGAFDYSNTDRAGSMRIGPASNLSGNGQDFQIFCSDFAVGGTTYTSTAPEAMRFKPDNGLRIDLQNNLLTKGYSASTALLDLGASRTTRASLRIRMGSAPTTPNIGDIYGTSTRDLNFNSNLVLPTVGDGIKIKEGIDATMGRATLVGGTVTVNTTKATTTCEIFLTSRVDGGTPGTAVRVSALSNGTSFTITSTNILDTSEISWLIIESV